MPLKNILLERESERERERMKKEKKTMISRISSPFLKNRRLVRRFYNESERERENEEREENNDLSNLFSFPKKP